MAVTASVTGLPAEALAGDQGCREEEGRAPPEGTRTEDEDEDGGVEPRRSELPCKSRGGPGSLSIVAADQTITSPLASPLATVTCCHGR